MKVCYNKSMKKFFLLLTTICLIMVSQPAIASNELIEDYLDIATSYAVSGNYPAAMEYLDKILTIEPQNRNILGLKNTLRQMQTGTFVSPMIAGTPKLFQAQNAKKAGNKLGEQQFLTSAATDGGYWTNMFAGDYYREAKQYQKALEENKWIIHFGL